MIEVLQFTAPWCRPCKPVEAIVAELAVAYPAVRFVTLNLDEEPDLGARYGVLTLPTVVILRAGAAVATIEGVRRRTAYERALAEVLPAA